MTDHISHLLKNLPISSLPKWKQKSSNNLQDPTWRDFPFLLWCYLLLFSPHSFYSCCSDLLTHFQKASISRPFHLLFPLCGTLFFQINCFTRELHSWPPHLLWFSLNVISVRSSLMHYLKQQSHRKALTPSLHCTCYHLTYYF